VREYEGPIEVLAGGRVVGVFPSLVRWSPDHGEAGEWDACIDADVDTLLHLVTGDEPVQLRSIAGRARDARLVDPTGLVAGQGPPPFELPRAA
jgi:hypothetical protein